MARAEFSKPIKREALHRSGGLCEGSGRMYGLAEGQRCNAPLGYGVEFDHVILDAGATGDFPRGKFNADDEGELRLAIGTKDKTVVVDFGKPVAWVGMPKQNAVDFANTILKHAEGL